MKRFTVISSLFLSTLLGFSSLHASTNVSAAIIQDTQWDANGNPYLIQGKVVVSKGSTLHIGPNVQVVFQGASALEVNGTLEVMGSASAPAVFNMSEGGLQSELYINGGEASLMNTKILSGVFLVKDSKLTLNGSEVTKGSGVYLQGSTTARLKNDKIYGNAAGVVLDGTVKATLTFDTIVQNTYGLYLKGFSDLEFKNNSVHDNQKEVVNNTPALNLGGNYWGTEDVNAIQAKVQGKIEVSPVKSLKDILRVYVRTMLPPITKEMSLALVAKEKREAKQEALALKKFKQGQTSPNTNVPPNSAAPAAEQAAAPAETAPSVTVPPEVQAQTPEVAEVELASMGTASIKALTPVPHSLKPLKNLPPDQGNVSSLAAAAPPASSTEASSNPLTAAPPVPDVATGSVETVIPPPEVSGSSTAAPPIPLSTDAIAPPAMDSTAPPAIPPSAEGTVPPPVDSMAPPDIETSAPPASPPAPPVPETKPAASGNSEAVPPPPDLGEQTAPPAVPAPPAASSDSSSTTTSPAKNGPPSNPPAAAAVSPAVSVPMPPAQEEPLPITTNTEPTAAQQKAVDSLSGVSGDVDGMEAPPVDLGLDGTTPSGTGSPSSNSGTNSTNSNDSNKNKSSSTPDSNLSLPPLQDSDVQPPKDLDMPPTDDLGNVNLDSRNK
jgi:hypothetical protein